MARFTVLEAPDGNEDRVVFVKEGYAPWALVLTVLWALWHRMWVVAAILFVVLAGISVAAGSFGLDATLAGWIEFAVALVFGFEARRLWMLSLEKAGYRTAGLIEASNLEAAELDYFATRPANQRQAVKSIYRPPADDMLNLFGNV
jgi:hypothetical protein